MDTRHLRSFIAAAESGSFSDAARRLQIAQPALSRHVKQIERELGVVLFDRSVHGVRLTEAGERLFHHARGIVKQFDITPQVIGGGNVIGGRVAIGLPHSAGVVLAGPLLKAAAKRLPQVHVHLVESVSGFLQEWVETNRLDLAILFDAQESPNIKLQPILVEDLYLVGATGSDVVSGRNVPFERLAEYPLVLPGLPHAHRRLLDALALSNGIQLDLAYEIDALGITLSIVEEGLAFAILSTSAVRASLESGCLQAARIVKPIVSRSVSLATSRVSGSTRACEAFGDLAISIARGLVANGAWLGTLRS